MITKLQPALWLIQHLEWQDQNTICTFQACIIGIDPIRCCNVEIGCNFASFTSIFHKTLVQQGMNYQNYIQSDCLLQNAVLHSSGHSIELLLDQTNQKCEPQKTNICAQLYHIMLLYQHRIAKQKIKLILFYSPVSKFFYLYLKIYEVILKELFSFISWFQFL